MVAIIKHTPKINCYLIGLKKKNNFIAINQNDNIIDKITKLKMGNTWVAS